MSAEKEVGQRLKIQQFWQRKGRLTVKLIDVVVWLPASVTPSRTACHRVVVVERD